MFNIKPKFAFKHPNWKMGKKISIDSDTEMEIPIFNSIWHYFIKKI